MNPGGPVPGTLYVLHFDRAYGHARHYLGWTTNLERRVEDHRRGYAGARLMEVVKEAGIGFTVAATFENATRNDERRLKNRGHTSDYCPICNPGRARVPLLELVHPNRVRRHVTLSAPLCDICGVNRAQPGGTPCSDCMGRLLENSEPPADERAEYTPYPEV